MNNTIKVLKRNSYGITVVWVKPAKNKYYIQVRGAFTGHPRKAKCIQVVVA